MINIHEKVVLTGNIKKAEMFIKFARTQMVIMLDHMRYNNLNQYKRTIIAEDRTTIICTSKFGHKKIHIHSPTKRELASYIKHLRCFCNCSLSIGIVIGPSESIYNTMYPSKDLRIDVIVCTKEEKFVRFNDCLGSDFTRYTVNEGQEIPIEDSYGSGDGWGFDERPWEGEPVILLLDNGQTIDDYLNCCSASVSKMKIDNGEAMQTACSTVYNPNGGLAPTFRIIPLVAFSMPRILSEWYEELPYKEKIEINV